MDKAPEMISAPVPAKDRVFDEIIQEVKEKTKTWANTPDKAEQAKNISELITWLDVAIRLDNNPAGAAFCAFKLAAEISQIAGAPELARLAKSERDDAMSHEIDEIIEGLKQGGQQPKAALVWKELVKRCGQPGTCCLYLENDPGSDEQIIAWGRPDGAVSRLKYSALQRRLVRKNDAKATPR